MVFFTMSPALHFSFPLETPPEHRCALEKAMPMILPTGSTTTSKNVEFMETTACEDSVRRVLEWLQSCSYVSCKDKGHVRAWVLTDFGKRSVRISNTLVHGGKVMKVRGDVELKEQEVLELLVQLEADEWRCQVQESNVVAKPYIVGEAKLFYLHPKSLAFNRWYLMALLTAETHKRPVKHRGGKGYYLSVMDGIEHVRKKRVLTMFDFEATTHVDAKKKERVRRLMEERSNCRI